MKIDWRQRTAVLIGALLAFVAISQLDETWSALKYWWAIRNVTPNEYVVHHWATLYTWGSALFAPAWLAVGAGTLFLLRRRPISVLIAMVAFLIVAPISCASAPSLYEEAGGPLGLEELPFADAERAADLKHLMRVDEQIKRWGDDRREFPKSSDTLRDAVGELAYESSPYEEAGKNIAFDLEFEMDEGRPYSAEPGKPGVVYYSVNKSGTQFVLTMSGLNAPIDSHPSMMKAGAFVGGKQPWDGLLATEEALYNR
jgi:hypothetical protein